VSEKTAATGVEPADLPVVTTPRRSRWVTVAISVLAAAALLSGALMRGWYLFHRPVSSDEAIAGLMARQILHGHFWTFYWGQSYGGVEPYLTAAGFAVFGPSAWVLRAVPVLLSLGAAVLAWRVADRVVRDWALALLVGAAVWAIPNSAVGTSFIEWGFRGVTLVCGLGVVLLALRILDGDRRWWVAGAAGLVAGIGWWSSPEITYFLVPAGLLLGAAWLSHYRAGARRDVLIRVGACAAGVVVGAFPWIWTNARTGFRSLRSSAFANPPGVPGFRGRLHLFVHYSMGMLASVRDVYSGNWLGGRAVGEGLLVLFLAMLAGSLVLCVKRRDRSIAFAVGVIVFPVLLALSPATWYWQTGRYIGYVVPLYVIVLAVGAAETGKWWSARRAPRHGRRAGSPRAARVILGAVVAVFLATTAASFVKDPTPGIRLASTWSDPNGPTRGTIQRLERAGIQQGYADYWVAYRLDFLSRDRLKFTVGRGEFVRWAGLDRQVRLNPRAAWIFVKPGKTSGLQFGVFGGPGGLTQTALQDDLRMNNIGFRVVDAGLVNAVVPSQPVPLAIVWPQT
jgi:hypothetical protein